MPPNYWRKYYTGVPVCNSSLRPAERAPGAYWMTYQVKPCAGTATFRWTV